MSLFRRRHNCLDDCWQLRQAVLEMFELLEMRIGDCEEALKGANIPIPYGRSAQQRLERIERGKQILDAYEKGGYA